MPSDPLVLLDTPIVAGSFAVSKNGPHVETEKRIWRSAVISLASFVSPSCMIRVPTPVCYELMAMNQEWFDFISNSQSEAFRFANYPIPVDIWKAAAEVGELIQQIIQENSGILHHPHQFLNLLSAKLTASEDVSETSPATSKTKKDSRSREEWKSILRELDEISKTPIPQEEIDEFRRQFQTLSPKELFEQFDI